MKLSIITVNYNNKAGLQETIDSLLSQTWNDYEWIIIDGGSTDGSRELIEQYQDYFAYWCSEPDKGVYHAMNKGVAKARGEYVNFMNSGDTFYNEYVLQKISDLQSDADIISGQAVRKDNQELLHKSKGSLFMQLYTGTISHQGAFIKRKLLTEKPYDENLKIVSDWKFWIQTIIWDDAIVKVTDVIVAIQDMTGISSDYSSRNMEIQKYEREKVLNEFFPFLLRKELDNYQQISQSPYTQYENYLRRENHALYAVGWRVLKFFVNLHKISHGFSK